jgi:hypothetical protein
LRQGKDETAVYQALHGLPCCMSLISAES